MGSSPVLERELVQSTQPPTAAVAGTRRDPWTCLLRQIPWVILHLTPAKGLEVLRVQRAKVTLCKVWVCFLLTSAGKQVGQPCDLQLPDDGEISNLREGCGAPNPPHRGCGRLSHFGADG